MPSVGLPRAKTGILLSILVVGAIACTTAQDEGPDVPGDAQAAGGDYPVVTFPDQGREHLTTGSPTPTYNSDPPTSGPHAPNTAPCGVHSDPIPDVVALHNLEHGVVVIHYQPTIPATELSELVDAVSGLTSHAVLAPRPNNPSVVTLSAWTVQLGLTEVDVDAIRWFWDEFSGHGPEVAACPMEVAP